MANHLFDDCHGLRRRLTLWILAVVPNRAAVGLETLELGAQGLNRDFASVEQQPPTLQRGHLGGRRWFRHGAASKGDQEGWEETHGARPSR